MGNISLKNIREWPELTNTEREIAIILASYPKGECPSDQELAKEMNLKESTIQKAMRKLRKKEMI